MPVPGSGGCGWVGGLCLSLSCWEFILVIVEARLSIAFCWPCRVFTISAIVKASEGDESCSEEAVSWDDTTRERGAEVFSSSSAQRMVSHKLPQFFPEQWVPDILQEVIPQCTVTIARLRLFFHYFGLQIPQGMGVLSQGFPFLLSTVIEGLEWLGYWAFFTKWFLQ